VHQKGLCIGCGACVDLCPYFKTYRGKTSMLFPCTLSEGRCYAYCPKAEVDLDALSDNIYGTAYGSHPLGTYRHVVMARAGKTMKTGPFQAGGTASALMSFALASGLIDRAVLTDREGLIPVPRLAEHPDDVLQYAASKYMAAPTIAMLNRAAGRGMNRMGVVGTPCQVTAVAQMRSNPLKKVDFVDPMALVVGLFCTWALDTRALISFLSARVDITEIRKMDIPPPPAEIFILETDKGAREIALDDIRPLVPGGCHICPDMTAEWADVAVGVLEGRPQWNTLIIRTEKGEALVKQAEKEGYLHTASMPEEKLAHLGTAAGNKKKRALLRAREEGLLNVSGAGKRSALRINETSLEKIIA